MSLNLLLIEDDDDDIESFKLLLKDLRDTKRHLEIATSLSDALTLLSEAPIDVILLDLFLPDSFGLEALHTLNDRHPHIPILVLTGSADDDLGLQAVKVGAQDFLTKGQITGPLLSRSLQYAIERNRLLLLVQQDRDRAEKELQSIIQFAAKRTSPLTSSAFGEIALSDSSPAIFFDLKLEFIKILELALEEQRYKDTSKVTTVLSSMSVRLGSLHAGPQDVVNVYRAALQEVIPTVTPEKSRAYLDEGRFLLLRLMGEVLSYYRSHSLKPFTPPNATSPPSIQHSSTARDE